MAATRGTDPAESPSVPAPIPPDDPDAWYAPDVRSQDEVHPGVVVTVRDGRQGFVYDVREPGLTEADVDALERVEEYFESAHIERPRTREGAVERMDRGFDVKHRTVSPRRTRPVQTPDSVTQKLSSGSTNAGVCLAMIA